MNLHSRHTGAAISLLLCILSRIPFTSHMLYNMDSAQFALGMDNFDVTLHQPQPPGYFLYVIAARVLNVFIGDHNTALITISIVCAGFAAAFVFSFADRLFGRHAAWFASLAFIASPSMWFHSEIALSYMPEAMMSVLVAMYCHTAITKRGEGLVTAAVLLGISGGIRQSSMVFLFPLFMFAVYRSTRRRGFYAILALGLTTVCWTLPMLYATGGLSKYLAYMHAHWRDSNWHGITLHWTLFNFRYMTYYIAAGLGLAEVPLLAWALPFVRKAGPVLRTPDERRMFLLWLLPAISFHLFIFTHPAVPGHSLIYVVGLIVLSSGVVDVIAKAFSKGSGRRYARNIAYMTSAAVLVGTAVFFGSPDFISYPGIRTHDRVLKAYMDTIRENFSPDDTEIIGSSWFLYSFRQAMYYLPGYRVYGDEFINTPDGPRLFMGEGRMTRRARYVRPRPGTRRFVDFIKHKPDDASALPPGAHTIPVDKQDILVYYDSADELARVSRIRRLLRPRAGNGRHE